METTDLLKDSQWSAIDGDLCRVIDFVPIASVEEGKILSIGNTPYATVALECNKFPTKINGFITHKVDFIHLWRAFKERKIEQDEEVLIIWTKRRYKNRIYKIFSAFMPRLWVMVCPEGAFKLMTDKGYRPELQGEARYKAERPIIELKPEVME